MRVNAIHLLRLSAARLDPKKDDGSYAFMLREMAEHLSQVRDGEYSWEDFAETYRLTERDRRSPGGAA